MLSRLGGVLHTIKYPLTLALGMESAEAKRIPAQARRGRLPKIELQQNQ